MDTLLMFFLNRSFLDIVEKNQKPVFLNQRVPPVSVYYLKCRAKFQIYRLQIRNSDWLNFIHFSGYKYKNRLVSILSRINLDIHHSKVFSSELRTLEWDILNPDRLINLEINNLRSVSSINPDIQHSGIAVFHFFSFKIFGF